MNRTTIALLSTSMLAGALAAQSDEDKYQKKLEKEFVSNASWVRTLDDAKAAASADNKLIFGYFTRSYSP